jgi:hypothetical protein
MAHALGRTPSDPAKLARRLWLQKYLTAQLPPIPATVDYTQIGESWGMLGNDTVGDCTCAAAGHAEQIGVAYGEKQPAAVTVTEVLAAYSAITGYVPGEASTDRGANMLDVLKYWQKTGIAGQKCGPYVAFDPAKQDHWQVAVYLFGFAYIGVTLPDSVVSALPNVVDWTDTTAAANQSNGHCVITPAYVTADGVTIVTWGQTIKASWAFLAKYCDEAYAVLLPSWGQGDPPGLDMATLQADLAVVKGGGALS